MGIEDVTTRVAGAVTSGMSSAEAEKSRRAVINDIEKESRDKTGLRSNVITLYNGGQYHLYRYKALHRCATGIRTAKIDRVLRRRPGQFRVSAIRLDICFFRVYENDQAVHAEHFLKWSEAGAAEGDLISFPEIRVAPSASTQWLTSSISAIFSRQERSISCAGMKCY